MHQVSGPLGPLPPPMYGMVGGHFVSYIRQFHCQGAFGAIYSAIHPPKPFGVIDLSNRKVISSIMFSFAMRFPLKFNHFSCLVLRIHLARCFQLSVMHLSIYQSKNKRFVEARSNVLS